MQTTSTRGVPVDGELGETRHLGGFGSPVFHAFRGAAETRLRFRCAGRLALAGLVAATAACTPSPSRAQPGTPAEEPGASAGVVDEYRLVPADASVRAGSTRGLEVQRCTREEESTAEGLVITALTETCTRLSDASLLREWSVNGTPGGSAAVGTVAPSAAGAVYTAPRELPVANPVAVSVEIRLPGEGKVLLVSHLTVVRGCPAPVCAYQGTSWEETVLGEGDHASLELRVRGEARVAWTFSHMDGRRAFYRASGEVGAAWTNAGCTIRLSPSRHTFAASDEDGGLWVDWGTDPVTYGGSGSSRWDGAQHWACGEQSWSDDAGGVEAAWFEGEGVAEGDGTVLRGELREAARRAGWELRAVP